MKAPGIFRSFFYILYAVTKLFALYYQVTQLSTKSNVQYYKYLQTLIKFYEYSILGLSQGRVFS
jgi:hypothetical protein